jgi:hypothetical protein
MRMQCHQNNAFHIVSVEDALCEASHWENVQDRVKIFSLALRISSFDAEKL